MCNPTKANAKDIKLLKSVGDNPSKAADQQSQQLERYQENLRKTVLYGSISTAFLIGGFSICMPYSQSRRDELNCDALCQGSMTSVRSFLNLIGSVLLGRLSDGTATGGGRKICLYIGTLGSFLDFIIMGTTFSIRGMWWSLVFGSLLQHNFGILKAMIADCYEQIDSCTGTTDDKTLSSPASRANSVGKIGMSVGLAFMIGPIVGGFAVGTFDHAILLGLFFVFISAVFILKIPNSQATVSKDDNTKNPSSSSSNGISSFLKLKAARKPAAIFFMFIRVAMGLAYHIFNTVWTVSLKTRFQFGPSDYGKFFSFIGLGFALSQGFLAGRLVRWFGPKRRVLLIQLCCVSLGLGRWFAFQTQSLRAVYFLFSFIITALGVMNTIITADTSKIASSDEIGGLVGLLDAVQSAAGMVGPMIGGILGQISWGKAHDATTNTTAPMIAVVGLYGIIFVMVLFGYDKFVVQEESKGLSRVTGSDGVDGKKEK